MPIVKMMIPATSSVRQFLTQGLAEEDDVADEEINIL
jgi:hypothetical protein